MNAYKLTVVHSITRRECCEYITVVDLQVLPYYWKSNKRKKERGVVVVVLEEDVYNTNIFGRSNSIME